MHLTKAPLTTKQTSLNSSESLILLQFLIDIDVASKIWPNTQMARFLPRDQSEARFI